MFDILKLRQFCNKLCFRKKKTIEKNKWTTMDKQGINISVDEK